jgi:Ca2+-binding RTX toxin-like protein
MAIILGTDGQDFLDPTADKDQIFGFAGDDSITVDFGDSADGGDDFDTLSFDLAALGFGVALDATYGVSSDSTVRGFEQFFLTLTGFDDRIDLDAWQSGPLDPDSLSYFVAATGAGNDVIGWSNAFNYLTYEIDSGDGDDVITVLSGIGSINAGAGNDTITTDDQFFSYTDVDGGAGNDLIRLGRDTDQSNVSGGSGSDTIFGGANADYIFGDEDDDTIEGGAGDDVLDGGSGNDEISAGAGFDQVSGGDGDDRLFGGVDGDLLSGDAGDDFLQLGIDGGEADGGTGNDTVNGGMIEDAIYGQDGDDVLSGRGGDDYVFGGRGADMIRGDDGNDYILASLIEVDTGSEIDRIFGGAGDDLIFAGTGDIVDGGSGIDTIGISFAGASAGVVIDSAKLFTTTLPGGMVLKNIEKITEIHGSAFDDIIRIAAGGLVSLPYRNSVSGLGGNDRLTGSDIGEAIDGGDGNDTLDGGGAVDTLLGGAGNDVIDGGTGDDRVEGGIGDDALNGGDGSDRLDGSDGNDTLDGGLGDDVLFGGLGNNSLFGGDGNDLIYADTGNDAVRGGLGIDTLSYQLSQTAGIKLFLANFNAQNTGGSGLDSVVGIENAVGTIFADTIGGTTLNNVLNGLAGETGQQVLAGNDTLSGGEGSDTLVGGLGADMLAGGSGADVFRFAALADSTVATAGRDTITDFARADGDKIGLMQIDADTTFAGDQAFVIAAAFSGIAGQLVVKQLTIGRYEISGDVDGDRVADFAINATSSVPLAVADFVL